jgi:hypothetical protein
METNHSPDAHDHPLKGINLVSFSTSIKLLFSGYLTTVAVGYLMALTQILFTHGMADGKFGLSFEDIVYSYYGDRTSSSLEGKLNGSMRDKAPDAERFQIIQWVRDGADERQYTVYIKPIIENHCVMCHNANSGSLPDFSKFETLQKYADTDTGATFEALVRVSHIHIFGISFIFMFVGLIFSFSTGVPKQYKYTAIVMPYLFLLVDIASWWLTKLSPHFAIFVVLAGTGMAVSFTYMWFVSMYQMWIVGPVLHHEDGRNALLREDD